MPHPLYLQIMGISIYEYNSYSPAKKERFQKAAREKLINLHESDIDAYNQLTEDAAQSAVAGAEQAEESAAEDKENS